MKEEGRGSKGRGEEGKGWKGRAGKWMGLLITGRGEGKGEGGSPGYYGPPPGPRGARLVTAYDVYCRIGQVLTAHAQKRP